MNVVRIFEQKINFKSRNLTKIIKKTSQLKYNSQDVIR